MTTVNGRRPQSGVALRDIVCVARDIVGDPLRPDTRGTFYFDRITGLDARGGTRVIHSTSTVPAGSLAVLYPSAFRDGRPHDWALCMPYVDRSGLWARYRSDGRPTFDTLEDARAYAQPFRVGAS